MIGSFLSRSLTVLGMMFWLACHCTAFVPMTVAINHRSSFIQLTASSKNDRHPSDIIRQEWIDRSLVYYRKVMREERRRVGGQLTKDFDTKEYQDEFTQLANRHYFALRKIKDGKPRHAESIYRRIIDELLNDDENCDHAKLAVTTLLLALLLQRMGAPAKETRSVFLHFFRVAVLDNMEGECACSAKVLGAFALFEMKQGNTNKSLMIAQQAVKLDTSLSPMLQWKQFKDVSKRRISLSRPTL
jgi:hypothetical protein